MAMKRIKLTFISNSVEIDECIEYFHFRKRPIDIIRRKSMQIILWANEEEIKIVQSLFRATVNYL